MSEPGRYQYLTFNSPLSDARAEALADRVARRLPADDAVVHDLGCGWGELLMRIAARAPQARAVGVDSDPSLVDRATAAATERHLGTRVTFDTGDAADDHGTADAVVCIGASHIWEGLEAALAALRARTRPGGTVVLGEGTWPPGAMADPTVVPPDMPAMPSTADLVDLAVGAGFRPLHVEEASREEWDAFESRYLRDLEEWLLAHPGHADADDVRRRADEHRTRWLRGYRGLLGLCYLTLGVPAVDEPPR